MAKKPADELFDILNGEAEETPPTPAPEKPETPGLSQPLKLMEPEGLDRMDLSPDNFLEALSAEYESIPKPKTGVTIQDIEHQKQREEVVSVFENVSSMLQAEEQEGIDKNSFQEGRDYLNSIYKDQGPHYAAKEAARLMLKKQQISRSRHAKAQEPMQPLTPFENGALQEFDTVINYASEGAQEAAVGMAKGLAVTGIAAKIGLPSMLLFALYDKIPETMVRRPIMRLFAPGKLGIEESTLETVGEAAMMPFAALGEKGRESNKESRDIGLDMGIPEEKLDFLQPSSGVEKTGDKKSMDDWTKKKAYEGFINNLLDEGFPWYLAYPLGMALEVVTDPAFWSRAGFQIARLAKESGDELAEQAAKSNVSIPAMKGVTKGTKSRLEFGYQWPWNKTRKSIPVPGTEEASEVLSKLQQVKWFGAKIKKLFTPAGKPPDPHMRFIEDNFVVPKKGDVGWEAYKVSKLHLGKFEEVTKNFSKRQTVEMGMVVEELPPALRGDPAAIDRLQRITSDEKVIDAAEHFAGIIQAHGTGYEGVTGDVVPKLNDKLRGLVSKPMAASEKILKGLEKRAGKTKKSFSSVLAKAKGVAESTARTVDEASKAHRGISDQLQVLEEYYTRKNIKKERGEILGGLIESEPDDIQKALLAEIAPGSTKAMDAKQLAEAFLVKEEASSAVPQMVSKIRKGLSVKLQNAKQEVELLDSLTRKADEMTTQEWDKLAGETLSLKSFDKRGSAIVKTMEDIGIKKARADRTVEIYQKVLDDKITPEMGEKMLKSADKIVRKAAEDAAVWRSRPGYLPRRGPKSKSMFVAPEPEFIHRPTPMSESSTFKQRTWIEPTGASKTRFKIEEELRDAISDPQFLHGSPKMPKMGREGAMTLDPRFPQMAKLLKKAYNTKSIKKAVALAQKDVKNGEYVVAKIIESDPAIMIDFHLQSLMSEAGKNEMSRQLVKFSSDVPSKVFNVHAKTLGIPRVSKMYPDRYFTEEILQQWHNYEDAVSAFAKAPGPAGQTVKVLTSMWKFAVTGWKLPFQFRNGMDDMSRYFSQGSYNPIQMHIDGVRAVSRSAKPSIDIGGKYGKISGEDLRMIGKIFRVTQTGLVEETVGSLNKYRAGRVFSLPEEVRRLGMLAQRMKQLAAKGEDGIAAKASAMVKNVAFSSENLAAWEKTYLRDFAIPFYSFKRQNLPFVMRQMYENPAWTRANMTMFAAMNRRNADDKQKVFNEAIPWMPSYMRDQAIYSMRGDLATSIVSIPGTSIADGMQMINALGNPIGVLNDVKDNWAKMIRRNFNPVIGVPVELLFGARTKGLGSDLTDIPMELEKLPDSALKFLGAKKEIDTKSWKDAKGKTRKEEIDRWVISNNKITAFRLLFGYNELKRILKPDSLKKMDSFSSGLVDMVKNKAVWRNAITGITDNRITDAEMRWRLVDDLRKGFEAEMSQAGMMIEGHPITRIGPLKGQKYGDESYEYLKMLRGRASEEKNIYDWMLIDERSAIRQKKPIPTEVKPNVQD